MAIDPQIDSIRAGTGQSISSIMIRAALERHRLPHIVPWRQYVVGGGLMSYGPDFVDIVRRSADYVDRILRARTLPSFPCKPPPSSSSRSISRPRKRLGSRCPRPAHGCWRGDRIALSLLRRRCPLLAQSGHTRTAECLFLG